MWFFRVGNFSAISMRFPDWSTELTALASLFPSLVLRYIYLEVLRFLPLDIEASPWLLSYARQSFFSNLYLIITM